MTIKNLLRLSVFVSAAPLLCFVGIGVLAARAQEPDIYHLQVMGVERFYITDLKGHSNRRIGCCLETIDVPGVVDYEVGSEPFAIPSPDSVLYPKTLIFIGDSTIDVKFRTTSDPTSNIHITRGAGAGQGPYTNLMIRYVDYPDLRIPSGVMAWLRFTPKGVSNLKLDKDGDGRFETEISPQFIVKGIDATDDKRPLVAIAAEVSGTSATVTITASDVGTGVKYIQYQLGDGNQTQYLYTGPFKIDISKPLNVWGIAADKAGNFGLMIKSFGTGDEERLRNENPHQRKYLNQDPFKLKSVPF